MIYAILSVQKPPEANALLEGLTGMSGEPLQMVSVNDISAVLGDMNKADLVADKTNAIRFAGVIDQLAMHFTLLPMRYGSFMQSDDTIAAMLERNYDGFQQNLHKVENRHEFGLKIFCDSEIIMEELRARSRADERNIIHAETEIKKSIYADYVNQKLKLHRLEEMLLSYVDSVIAEIIQSLSNLNANHKIRKMVTPSNIIDAVFLLEKNKKTELVQTIEAIQSKYPGLKFVLTGPWPPYNFVDFAVT